MPYEVDIELIRTIPDVRISNERKHIEIRLKDKIVTLSDETLEAYNDAVNPSLSLGLRLRRFLTARSKAGKIGRTLKEFALIFFPYGDQVSDVTGLITNLIYSEMEDSKPALSSKTIITNLILGVVGVLIVLGVMPDSLDLSPDAGWVVTLSSVLNLVLRAVTKQPISISGS